MNNLEFCKSEASGKTTRADVWLHIDNYDKILKEAKPRSKSCRVHFLP